MEHYPNEKDSVKCKCTIDAVFILRRIQKEYLDKQKKLYMCFVELETVFDRVLRKVVEWAMRKKGVPESLVKAVIGLYKGANTKVKVGTHFSEELEVNIAVHHIPVLSALLFDIVFDVAKNKIKEGMLQELLYADDIILIAETMAELWEKYHSWKSALDARMPE